MNKLQKLLLKCKRCQKATGNVKPYQEYEKTSTSKCTTIKSIFLCNDCVRLYKSNTKAVAQYNNFGNQVYYGLEELKDEQASKITS